MLTFHSKTPKPVHQHRSTDTTMQARHVADQTSHTRFWSPDPALIAGLQGRGPEAMDAQLAGLFDVAEESPTPLAEVVADLPTWLARLGGDDYVWHRRLVASCDAASLTELVAHRDALAQLLRWLAVPFRKDLVTGEAPALHCGDCGNWFTPQTRQGFFRSVFSTLWAESKDPTT